MNRKSAIHLVDRPLDSGYHFRTERLHRWKPLLDEWISMVESYSDDVPGDVTYWHTERAHIGLLAAAAWRRSFLALEEFSQKKRRGKAKSTGRTDVWIKIASEENFIEAKAFTSPNSPKEAGIRARTLLRDACAEARRTVKDRTTTAKVGLVFARARIPRTRDVDNEIRELRSQIARCSYDVIFWHFAPSRRHWPPSNWRSPHFFPGIIVIARTCR